MPAAVVAADRQPEPLLPRHVPARSADSTARNLYTHSEFSHASPLDIQKIAPAQWTIEASVKAAKFPARPRGSSAATRLHRRPAGAPARLIFQINAAGRFAIGFHDAAGRFHEAVAEELPVEAGRWYHLAATATAARCGSTSMPWTAAAMSSGLPRICPRPAPPRWARAQTTPNGPSAAPAMPASRPLAAVRGWIDEVRISDIARRPAEFLFSPK